MTVWLTIPTYSKQNSKNSCEDSYVKPQKTKPEASFLPEISAQDLGNDDQSVKTVNTYVDECDAGG